MLQPKSMEAMSVKGWENLRMVETIYEEECEDSSSTTPPLSPPLSSPSNTPLHSRVKAWTLSTGLETDVVIHVEGSRFHLHKDPLVTSSGYMKRQLYTSSEITLSPPLKLTADTFSLVADYCYGGHLFITPFNVASLLTAAEFLEMTDDSDSNESLRQKTEAYFCRTVAVNRDYTAVVLRSCLPLLPEAETEAAILSRCIKALSLKPDAGGDIMGNFDGIKALSLGDFQLAVEALHQRLTGNHDILYGIVDLYLKEHGCKTTEEQKKRICNNIDCTYLSSQLLMHAVQNPRMPLRFVVQAMFIEQLNTRRTLFSASNAIRNYHHESKDSNAAKAITLGAILQRDATLREVAQLKATMDTTSSRIQSLEQELNSMRNILDKSEMNSGKSESFRFSSETKVERGQKGSVSSGSFRSIKLEDERKILSNYSLGDQGSTKRFGERLLNGLRSAFRVSGLASKSNSRTQMEVERQR